MTTDRRSRWPATAFLLLLVNSGWIWAFPSPDLFYLGNILLHVLLGAALCAGLWFSSREIFRSARRNRASAALLSIGAALGGALCFIGATRPNLWIVIVHASCGFAGAALLARGRNRKPLAAALGAALLLPASAHVRNRWFPRAGDRIVNPASPPLSMYEEGAGAESPFFPSSSNTDTGALIPSDFFMDSATCGECHVDIYEQWRSSMHHFSSFNNQFYRKSIEYMQETAGVEASKWCAGCHDHAMFFNGMFDEPAAGQLDTPEAHAGLGCMSCHSIVHVPDTMGNGGFTIEYPPLHELTRSGNRLVRAVHDYVTNIAPAAHRKAFLKPFMREDGAEFCATCHKVHLDVPVNGYRWIRGFNSYDNWQASGVSGHGARSFYYPEKPQDCADCHMPLTPSDDPGNVGGMVHSHRFPAANTAVPYVNRDEKQLAATRAFLENNIVTVDIFAVSPALADAAAPQMIRRSDQLRAATGFAVAEESGLSGAPAVLRAVGNLAAPIDRARPVVEPGETVIVDVVARTRTVGHVFPGGTVDAFDVWVEIVAEDAAGEVFFWSGRVADDGRGPVDPGAHFYRSLQLDAHGNPIDKRNAFHMRSLLYARLIPPSTADTVHFRIEIPENAKGPIKLEAKLNHRKFSHAYTAFSYAGKAGEGQFGPGFDDREFTFDPADIPANVSGKIKDRIPALPITVLARAEAELAVGRRAADWAPQIHAGDWERWNDYGIGLLLQGDLKGAEHAFERAVEADPSRPDGPLNIGRVLVEEGRTAGAKAHILEALRLSPELPRALYFLALTQKAEGDYDAALDSLERVASRYPKDRVVLNEIAGILFLRRDYAGALEILDRVARIDPEDLRMHYTKMRCYRGLGDAASAEREEKLFLRFKADESAQTGTADFRRARPEDNNERQSIHEHVSVPL